MRALVTGATGFVGSHVVRRLIERGVDVSCLIRPQSPREALAGLPVKTVVGNLTDRSSLESAVQGIDLLFHVAADYRFWVPDPKVMHDVNVGGTIRLLEAAITSGVRRIVYTSSAVTVACTSERAGTETDFLAPEACQSIYQRTKVLAEQAVWGLIRSGGPITIVNPSTPIGAMDRRPTPTGRLIVDFLNGRLPAYLDALFNWVHVGDVGMGHWLAAEKGRVGERYILGHENLLLGDFLQILSQVSGRPAPRMKIPYAVAWMAGAVGELTGRLSEREPRATLDGVRMASIPMRYDSSKAIKELGFPQTPLRTAAAEAVEWFRTHGHVTTGRHV
ncbi:MAG: NAD-dependent epimerase/dehydratase family protein [Nitrospira sp.]|nr:NAD-dependent epimerase/dehydratase family protein [Nitrospira sp.]MDH5498110.1 NAD-dependent epimerase/dehydratase family protein [Nitrospira sp.]